MKRTIEELWEAWHANRGRAERDALVVHYQPLVETVAKGHIQSSYSRDWDRVDDAKASVQKLTQATENAGYPSTVKR